uniref:Uncharacterized protein n=1 Tax=Rhizophora mucronata TaxID=61149 RepID=A0A2P2NZQ3_RHIMU
MIFSICKQIRTGTPEISIFQHFSLLNQFRSFSQCANKLGNF